MRAEVLTRALGGRWHGHYGTARCPAHQDSTPSLSIKDGDDGRLLVYCHAGCNFESIWAAIRDCGLDDQQVCHTQFGRLPRVAKDQRPLIGLAGIIWKQAIPIIGTTAERYLLNRSIDSTFAASLRFHRNLRHPSGQHLPAMLGLVENARSELKALHRTYLNARTAQKTDLRPDKAMLAPCKGGAVRLLSGRNGLAVCEGIETALSFASGLEDGYAVWAGLSKSGVAGLHLPPRNNFSNRLIIGTDGDGAGRKAGLDLADRATALGWDVEIAAAPERLDFNDLLRSEHRG